MGDQPFELTEQAVRCGQLKQLLTGSAGYGYVPKYSPAHRTDMAMLVPHGLHEFQRRCHDSEFSEAVASVLLELASDYDGIISVAAFLLTESCIRSDMKSPFTFSLEPIAVSLRNSIHCFETRLSLDRTEDGENWPDGLYGLLRSIAKKSVECGGPDFFGLKRRYIRFR